VSGWTADELARIGAAGEVNIATPRADDTLRTPRIVWVVRHIVSPQARATTIELVPRPGGS
jgi:hypothetical protein